MQNRRAFIKQSCGMCLGAIGLGLLASQLSSCAPLPVYKTSAEKNLLTVPLSSFTDKATMLIVRNPNQEYDILLVKRSDGTYNALQMKCTHQDNPLTASQSGLFCSSHGSSFNLNGDVTKEPAISPLKKYKTVLNGDKIEISLI